MEGTVLVIPKYSPPRAVHGGTRKEVNTINEFAFDLQRFDGDYEKIWQIGSETTKQYATLQEAITAASAGDTLNLLADDNKSFAAVTTEQKTIYKGTDGNSTFNDPGNSAESMTVKVVTGNQVIINKNLTIEGNGHTIYGLTAAEIKNVTNDAEYGDVPLDENSPPVLGIWVSSGDVTINNLKMSQFGDADYVNKFGYVPIQTSSQYSGTLTLTNVDITNFNRQAICVRGGTGNITSGVITANAANKGTAYTQFQQPIEVRSGTATIKDVTITSSISHSNSNAGAIVTWSDITIEDVDINFTGKGIWSDGGTNGTTVKGNNTKVNTTSDALFAEEGNKINVEAGIYIGSVNVDNTANSTINITGGIFKESVASKFVVDGYLFASGYGQSYIVGQAGWNNASNSTTAKEWYYLANGGNSTGKLVLDVVSASAYAAPVFDGGTSLFGLNKAEGWKPTWGASFADGKSGEDQVYHLASFSLAGTAVDIMPLTTGVSIIGASSIFGTTDITKLTAQGNSGIYVDAAQFTSLSYIAGGGGSDILKAGNRKSTLIGNAGNDTLYGASSADYLFGGLGNDWMFGGSGSNTFFYTSGNDTIADYKYGTDVFSLSGITKAPTTVTAAGGNSGGIVLGWGGESAITFTGAQSVKLQLDGDNTPYVYTLNYVMHGMSASLFSTATMFSASGTEVRHIYAEGASSKGVTIIGSTGDDSIWGGAGASYIGGGASVTAFSVSGFDTGDVIQGLNGTLSVIEGQNAIKVGGTTITGISSIVDTEYVWTGSNGGFSYFSYTTAGASFDGDGLVWKAQGASNYLFNITGLSTGFTAEQINSSIIVSGQSVYLTKDALAGLASGSSIRDCGQRVIKYISGETKWYMN